MFPDISPYTVALYNGITTALVFAVIFAILHGGGRQ